jgi:hypothetical protein
VKRPTPHRRTAPRVVRALLAGLALSGAAVPGTWAGDWEQTRDSFDETLRSHARRLAEIDARERGDPADRVQRAEKITRDRIAGINASLNRRGRVRSLAEAAAIGSLEASALPKVSREQAIQLESVIREWGTAGPERRKLRESLAAFQKTVDQVNANLAGAIDAADATSTRIAESGVLEAVARIEAEAAEAGNRLRARWQREYDARERERLHRDRAAAERERGVR